MPLVLFIILILLSTTAFLLLFWRWLRRWVRFSLRSLVLFVLVIAAAGALLVRSLSNERVLVEHGHSWKASLSANGRKLAVSLTDSLDVRDTGTLDRLQNLPQVTNSTLAFSPQGDLLAIGDLSGVRVLNVMDGAVRRVPEPAQGFGGFSDPAERVAAARLAERLIGMGVPLIKGRLFLALELLSSPDATFRDPKKAAGLIEDQLKERADDPLLQFTLAYARGDRDAMEKARKSVRSSDEGNNLAWGIVSRFPVGVFPAEWAMELAQPVATNEPLDSRQFPYFADTYAAACAYAGDFAKALEWQEKALSRLTQDDPERSGIGERVAYYYASTFARQEERPRMVLEMPPVGSKVVRDALLRRLASEQDRVVRGALVRIVQARFASDKEAAKVLKRIQDKP